MLNAAESLHKEVTNGYTRWNLLINSRRKKKTCQNSGQGQKQNQMNLVQNKKYESRGQP